MTDISVFTLNCWGIGMGVSRDRVVRMRAIGQHLASSSYDIVCLQEVWCPEDFITICDLTRDVLPYNHFFDHGIIGSGTCVLSKAQILDSAFHEFSQNGYPHKILHGDWFAGKGIGICNIDYKVLFNQILRAGQQVSQEKVFINEKDTLHRNKHFWTTCVYINNK